MNVAFPESFAVSQDPIFIVGFPRSGTTLVQALLATQENICSFPETHFFFYVQRFVRTDKSGYVGKDCLPQVFHAINAAMELEFPPAVAGAIGQAAEERQLDLKSLFELIVWQYVSRQTQTDDTSRTRWVEKSPYHVFFLRQISTLYPAARFVHVIRNPLYAISSALKMPFGIGHSLFDLADKWRACLEIADGFRQDYPGRIDTVRYDDLANDPEGTLARVCGYLGIPFRPDLLSNYKETGRALVLSREYWKKDVLASDIVNSDVQTKHPISLADILRIQNIAGEQMAQNGYPISSPHMQMIFDFGIRILGSLGQEEALSGRDDED